MKERSEILRDILELAKNELNDNGSIGYTMPDGKHHIYISVDKSIEYLKDDVRKEDYYYFIEPNTIEADGSAWPIGENATAEYNDFAELLIGCAWCLEEFERDIERKKEIDNAEINKYLPRVVNCRDYEILKRHLTVDSLKLIDDILKAAGNGRIDLQIPRDADGNIEFVNIGFVVKDISYVETGLEKLVLKWYDDFENTDYLIDVFEDVQENLKTYEFVVDHMHNGKSFSFEFSCVAENHPGMQWLADQIFEKLSEKYADLDYHEAVNSIDSIGLQVTQNGEWISGDELMGEELKTVLDQVIGRIQFKQVSIDEQISAAKEFVKPENDLKQGKNTEYYK